MANQTQTNTYDYIVVGAGAAGSIVAAKLSGAGHSVMLLEAGTPTTDPKAWQPPY